MIASGRLGVAFIHFFPRVSKSFRQHRTPHTHMLIFRLIVWGGLYYLCACYLFSSMDGHRFIHCFTSVWNKHASKKANNNPISNCSHHKVCIQKLSADDFCFVNCYFKCKQRSRKIDSYKTAGGWFYLHVFDSFEAKTRIVGSQIKMGKYTPDRSGGQPTQWHNGAWGRRR